eukprot:3792340-Prymnesium_polylepis.2
MLRTWLNERLSRKRQSATDPIGVFFPRREELILVSQPMSASRGPAGEDGFGGDDAGMEASRDLRSKVETWDRVGRPDLIAMLRMPSLPKGFINDAEGPMGASEIDARSKLGSLDWGGLQTDFFNRGVEGVLSARNLLVDFGALPRTARTRRTANLYSATDGDELDGVDAQSAHPAKAKDPSITALGDVCSGLLSQNLTWMLDTGLLSGTFVEDFDGRPLGAVKVVLAWASTELQALGARLDRFLELVHSPAHTEYQKHPGAMFALGQAAKQLEALHATLMEIDRISKAQ